MRQVGSRLSLFSFMLKTTVKGPTERRGCIVKCPPRSRSVRREASLPGGLAGGKGLHIGRGQRLATDPPIPALNLFDDYPGYRAHILPFRTHHGVPELPHSLALLHVREGAFNSFALNQGHEYFLGEFECSC